MQNGYINGTRTPDTSMGSLALLSYYSVSSSITSVMVVLKSAISLFCKNKLFDTPILLLLTSTQSCGILYHLLCRDMPFDSNGMKQLFGSIVVKQKDNFSSVLQRITSTIDGLCWQSGMVLPIKLLIQDRVVRVKNSDSETMTYQTL